jgi:DmsE family decaheme c-type cytochrome
VNRPFLPWALTALSFAGAASLLAQEAPRPGYAGSEACAGCHPERETLLLESDHAGILRQKGLDGCETCHGPGKDHSDSGGSTFIRNPTKAQAADLHQVCSLCHGRELATVHANEAAHRARGESCARCHEVHRAKKDDPRRAHPGVRAERAWLAERAKPVGPDRCAGCHSDRRETLAVSAHASLLAGPGCEECHGTGSLHADSGGARRFILNPKQRPLDALRADCRKCHDVRGTDYHDGRGRFEKTPCVQCHTIHLAKPERPAPPKNVRAHAERPEGGNAECRRCHAPSFDQVAHSMHRGLLERPDGCEACHGPSGAHAAAGGRPTLTVNPAKLPPGRKDEFCLKCHSGTKALLSWNLSGHRRRGIGCLDCHPMGQHAATPTGEPARVDSFRRCGGCHGAEAAQFRLPNRHRVPEAMQCWDCHQPHGEAGYFQKRELREDACYRCHREKRGPFVYEHPAGRIDGCTACHLPHGSINRRLLTHRDSRDLCSQCHSVIPIFHDQSPGSPYRNCLNCHTEQHGSRFNRFLFR